MGRGWPSSFCGIDLARLVSLNMSFECQSCPVRNLNMSICVGRNETRWGKSETRAGPRVGGSRLRASSLFRARRRTFQRLNRPCSP